MVSFNSDSSMIIAGLVWPEKGYNLIIWDTMSGQRIHEIGTGIINGIAINPKNNDIVVGLVKGHGVVYDSTTYEQKNSFEANVGVLNCLAFSSDGQRLVVGGNAKSFILYPGNYAQRRLVGHDGKVFCVAFSPDGYYLISGFTNHLILWNKWTGHLLQKFDVGAFHKNCITFTPDSHSIVCGGKYHLTVCHLIDPKTLKYIATQLDISQARLFYRLYLAKINNEKVILDKNDSDYQIYLTLPQDVQQVIKDFLPFILAAKQFEQDVREKMNEYRSSLFYKSSYIFGKTEKTRKEKIEAVKNALQKMDKNSADYKACVALLYELEQEAAFDL